MIIGAQVRRDQFASRPVAPNSELIKEPVPDRHDPVLAAAGSQPDRAAGPTILQCADSTLVTWRGS